ncbi:MAG: DUF308 domain-containing protein [Clostridia bacterium]|nr:DUF308 domain-containing protein [Clostridia bacterium]
MKTAEKPAEKIIAGFKWERIAAAVLSIIIGILFIALPETSANVLCIISGIVLVLIGVVAAVSSFTEGAVLGRYSLMLGIALALAGTLCILRPTMVTGILCAIFGIIIAVDGAITFIDAIDCARAKLQEWRILMLISLVSMALGAVIMFVESSAIMVLAGVFLIIEGVIDIVIICLFGKQIKRAKRIVAQAVKVEDAEAPEAPAPVQAVEAAASATAEKTEEELEKQIEEDIDKLGRE